MDKVLVDFGVRDKPEGYVTGSDRVRANMDQVARTEMERLNREGRYGEVKFQSTGDLKGKYYKQVKRYENYRPVDVRAESRTSTSQSSGGYVGYIDFTFRVYESARTANRTEAAAMTADIPTNERGQDSYRYRFGSGDTWTGGKGTKARR